MILTITPTNLHRVRFIESGLSLDLSLHASELDGWDSYLFWKFYVISQNCSAKIRQVSNGWPLLSYASCFATVDADTLFAGDMGKGWCK